MTALVRRDFLSQIIAFATAPVIIRVAPLMRINPALARPAPEFYALCKFNSSTMPGVAVSVLRTIGDRRGWLLVVGNATTMPLEHGRKRLRAGEEYVLASSPHLRRYRWAEPPPLI